MRSPILALIVVFSLAGAPTASAASTVLKVAPATQNRLGIATAPLTATRRGGEIKGFARAIDAVPLATLDADIAAAAAALSASQAEATRTRALNAADQTVSKKAAEAAAAQARADQAKLTLLRRRLGLEWGPALLSMSDARRSRLIADLAAGRATLVRIDSATGISGRRGAATLDLGAGVSARADILGPARVSDPRLPSTGLLALVTGPHAAALGVGATASASIAASAGLQGVLIPRAALLRTAGQTFAYVRRDGASFERRPVVGAISDPAGLFAASGFRPGEAVVVKGAAQLFAAERPPQDAE